MEWVVIIGQIVQALGPFIMKAIESGNVASVLDTPLRDILPHELRTTIAKKLADEAAARKFEGA
jgi:hypothetical protein